MKWAIIQCLLIAYLTRSEASDTADKIMRKIRCKRTSDPIGHLPKPCPKNPCQEDESYHQSYDECNGCQYTCDKLKKPKERTSDPIGRELPKPCSDEMAEEMACQKFEELEVEYVSNGCRYTCHKLKKPKEHRRIARLFKASDKKNAKTHMKQLDLARSQDATYKIMRKIAVKKGEWRSLNSGKRCIPTKDNKGRCVFIHHFDGSLNKSENKNRKNDANAL